MKTVTERYDGVGMAVMFGLGVAASAVSMMSLLGFVLESAPVYILNWLYPLFGIYLLMGLGFAFIVKESKPEVPEKNEAKNSTDDHYDKFRKNGNATYIR